MKTFEKTCAQGDVFFTKIDALPEDIEEIKPEGGHVVVAHSETGHHHVMERTHVKHYQPKSKTYGRLPEEIYEAFLVVEEPTALKHLRDFDTHEPIMFDAGVYRVRRQREHTPEGYRRVED